MLYILSTIMYMYIVSNMLCNIVITSLDFAGSCWKPLRLRKYTFSMLLSQVKWMLKEHTIAATWLDTKMYVKFVTIGSTVTKKIY